MAGVVATLVDVYKPQWESNRRVDRYTLTNGVPAIAPGAATGGTVVGASASLLGVCSDVAGQFQVVLGSVAGSIPAAGGTLCTLTFANVLAGSAFPTFGAANVTAGVYTGGTADPYTVAGSTNFSIVGGSAGAASGTLIFNYDVANAAVSLTLQSKYMLSPEEVLGPSVVSYTTTNTGAITAVIQPYFSTSYLEVRGER